MQAAVIQLQTEGLPAIPLDEIKALKKGGNFIWLAPQLNSSACTPETCRHAIDNPPGFVVIPEPDGGYQMLCRHAECGDAAQQSLIDHEAEQQREVERRRQEAIDQLRQATIERTLFGELGLCSPEVMEVLESILVPEWDTASMEHVVIGWQKAMVAQLVVELDCTDAQPEFEVRYGLLANAPTTSTIRHQFVMLREQFTQEDRDWSHWLACLVLVKGCRD